MAATILGAGKLVSILIGLVNVGIEGFDSLQKVSVIIEKRRAEGKPVTQGDLWSEIEGDDAAKDALEEAIRESKA